MNIVLILLVFALVLAILQAVLAWIPPSRPVPHLGWLAFACFVAARLFSHP